MRNSIFSILLLVLVANSYGQDKRKLQLGIYLQWGYNAEWYSKSNIHFTMANGDRFTLHKAAAKDKPDMRGIFETPQQISIPQYNYRIGFYINQKRSRSIELNFDHLKNVLIDGQKVHVSGTIDGISVNGDSILNPLTFLHFEHTDGGNLLHFNYVEQATLLLEKHSKRPLLNFIWKAGAGITIPRTDFTYRGNRLNNNFHIAGFNISGETGVRIYPFKKVFLEFTGNSGYVKYVNSLYNTKLLKGNRARHSFYYFEMIGLLGFDISF